MIGQILLFLIGFALTFLAGYVLCKNLLFQGDRKDHIGCGMLFAALYVFWRFMLFLAKTL